MEGLAGGATLDKNGMGGRRQPHRHATAYFVHQTDRRAVHHKTERRSSAPFRDAGDKAGVVRLVSLGSRRFENPDNPDAFYA
jgi:hypothetical protein